MGILKEFTRAFENYTKEDITGILINTDDLVKEFTQKLDETTALFADVPKDQYDRETMNKAFQTITSDEESTKKFQANYKRLRKLFELLGPHPIKLEKLKDYTWLTQVYNFYLHETRQDVAKENALAYKYFQKTLKYVYKSTEVKGIEEQYPTIEFDADYLINLQEKLKTKEEKAANILFTLNRFVIIDKQRNPVYEGLAAKVERLLDLWKEKTKTIRQNLQRRRRNLPTNPSTPSKTKTTPILKPTIRHPAKHGKSHPKPRRPNQRHPRTRLTAATLPVQGLAIPTNRQKSS